jgi:hypothetical protein
MTVETLIALLNKCPPKAEVLIRAVATSNNYNLMVLQAAADGNFGQAPAAELSQITEVTQSEDGETFVAIDHHLEYLE